MSSTLSPNRVLVVDKRLLPVNDETFHFITLSHPRTHQEQTFAIDDQSQCIFELVQCARTHASWFIHDQYVLPDGSLYLLTPIHVNFLLLPSLWSIARVKFISLDTIIKNTTGKLPVDSCVILDRLESICDIDRDTCAVQLNDKKLFPWLRNRFDRLRQHLNDDEQAFDILSEYLSDEITEQCQHDYNCHGHVRYELSSDQQSTVNVTTGTSNNNKMKRTKKSV
jgi:hypothetical protein